MQKNAADDVVARSRAALLREPDLIFLYMTIDAPCVESIARQVEILTTLLRWLLRHRARSKRSAWAVIRGTYWWLDFAPRPGHSKALLGHLHILLLCDSAILRRFAHHESSRRASRGLPAYRKWAWPLVRHGFRRDVVAGMEHLCPKEFAAAKVPSFFHVTPLRPHSEQGADDVVQADRREILENVRKVADYSWATDIQSELGQLSMAQRVTIECLPGRHRGCSGVLRGIPGITAAIKSLRRRRTIGRRMASQIRADDDFERLFGPPQSESGS